jgi:hypothetical protein
MDNRNEASIHCRLIWLKKRLICYQNVNSSSMVNFDCAQFDNRFEEAPSVSFAASTKFVISKKLIKSFKLIMGSVKNQTLLQFPLFTSEYE